MKKRTYKYRVICTTKNGNRNTLWAYTKAEANEMVQREKANGAVSAYVIFA